MHLVNMAGTYREQEPQLWGKDSVTAREAVVIATRAFRLHAEVGAGGGGRGPLSDGVSPVAKYRPAPSITQLREVFSPTLVKARRTSRPWHDQQKHSPMGALLPTRERMSHEQTWD